MDCRSMAIRSATCAILNFFGGVSRLTTTSANAPASIAGKVGLSQNFITPNATNGVVASAANAPCEVARGQNLPNSRHTPNPLIVSGKNLTTNETMSLVNNASVVENKNMKTSSQRAVRTGFCG